MNERVHVSSYGDMYIYLQARCTERFPPFMD